MLKPFDSEYFRALLILLPGFLSREVAHYFAPFPSKSSDLEILIVCLAFSIVNIMLAIGVWSAGVRMSRRSGDSNEGRQPFGPFIALLLAISLVTGWSWSRIDESEWIYSAIPSGRVRSKLPVFGKSMQENDQANGSMVVLEMKNGKRYWGWPRYYEVGPDEQAVYLEPAGRLAGSRCPTRTDYEEAKACSEMMLKGVFANLSEIAAIEFLPRSPPLPQETGPVPGTAD